MSRKWKESSNNWNPNVFFLLHNVMTIRLKKSDITCIHIGIEVLLLYLAYVLFKLKCSKLFHHTRHNDQRTVWHSLSFYVTLNLSSNHFTK